MDLFWHIFYLIFFKIVLLISCNDFFILIYGHVKINSLSWQKVKNMMSSETFLEVNNSAGRHCCEDFLMFHLNNYIFQEIELWVHFVFTHSHWTWLFACWYKTNFTLADWQFNGQEHKYWWPDLSTPSIFLSDPWSDDGLQVEHFLGLNNIAKVCFPFWPDPGLQCRTIVVSRLKAWVEWLNRRLIKLFEY